MTIADDTTNWQKAGRERRGSDVSAVFVTNIPAPYRVSMYNDLQACSALGNRSFRVLFMNNTEPNRSWSLESEMEFQHELWDQKILEFGGMYLRFSWQYVQSALRSTDHIVLGGGWNELNVVCLVLLKRLGVAKQRLSFWTEANALTTGARRPNMLKTVLRRWIFNSADGHYYVPGKMSVDTLEQWGVNTAKKVVLLPNLPHPDFEGLNPASDHVQSRDLPKMLIVARLHEETKGVLHYFKQLGATRIRELRITVAGDGPDRRQLEAWLTQNRLEVNVQLAGDQTRRQLITLLTESDLFCLPSLSDQSPLALVEACWAGLPTLVSSHCGNHFECVQQGRSGYVFNPLSTESCTAALDEMLKRRSEWREMGVASREMAEVNFNRRAVLARLAASL